MTQSFNTNQAFSLSFWIDMQIDIRQNMGQFYQKYFPIYDVIIMVIEEVP